MTLTIGINTTEKNKNEVVVVALSTLIEIQDFLIHGPIEKNLPVN